MIQEIPYKYDPAYKDKKPELTDYLLHYEYNKVMLLKEKEGYVKRRTICFPSVKEAIIW